MPDEFDLGELSLDDGTQEPSPEPVVELAPEETLGNQFLTGIPEQDRAIVAKYVKDWDGNVTKKFQSIHDQYKPYKELGELEQLQQAREFYQGWAADPEVAFFTILKQLAELHEDPQTFAQYMYEKTGVNPMSYDQTDGTFDPGDEPNGELLALLEQQGQQMQEFNEWREAQEEAQQNAYEQQELDNVMSAIHNAVPGVDDNFILAQFAAGADPAQAVQAWQKLTQSFGGNSQQAPRRTPPTVMGGQGGVPSGQVDPSKLGSKDRKALIDQFLSAQNQ